jgi:tetratricopeptide (TPR) repeat protein
MMDGLRGRRENQAKEHPSMTTIRAVTAFAMTAALGAGAAAAEKPAAKPDGKAAARTFTLTTKSDAARDQLREIQHMVETFQGGPPVAAKARAILELDPDFAMAMYYLSASTPPPDNQKHLDKAVELSKKSSEGERRFIEAMVLARGKTPADAVEPMRKLIADYPGERVLYMLLGQNLAGLGRHDEAKAAYEEAVRISGDTPRAYQLLANYHLMKGDYAKARDLYAQARTRIPKGVPPGAVAYGTAFTYLYEGNVDQALATLTAFVDDFKSATVRPGPLPEVFIWNSIARINLENGRLDAAMKAYEKGFESVPGSGLDEEQKKIWTGRLHHGRGRTLARMGRHAEAWKEAETIQRMIAEGGERGKQFEPAYHYLAGYLKLEAGETAAAIEHLQKSDVEDDPFHKLLLARAYEKAGKKDEAKKLYTEIVNFPQSNMERALAYPEAKKRLAVR